MRQATEEERWAFLAEHKASLAAQHAEHPLPSLAEQAGNALGAAGRVFGALVRGKPVLVDDATKAARLATCHACDRYIASKDRCAKCGCKLMKGKTSLATEECPLKKWPATA